MPGPDDGQLKNYSLVDRWLHRLAFGHKGIQRLLADLEDDLFKARLARVQVRRPVFVTALPRAGTTLLLELLYSTGEFTTFTYRQMPFVLNPLLWDRISARFRVTGRPQERAHGDGMTISFDSPEAFEEVIWLNYLRDRIVDGNETVPLSAADITPTFETAMHSTVRKLIAVDDANGRRRYLSKNNANIARLAVLERLFPDATVLVCLRHPMTHVASLMTQHERFLAMHDDDPFARSYMEWIGHYDFGANFKPIRFGDRRDRVELQGLSHDFWLQYWIDAYRCVRESVSPRCAIVCYESLLSDGAATLARVADCAGLERKEAFVARCESLRAPTSRLPNESLFSGALLHEAVTLYDELRSRSL